MPGTQPFTQEQEWNQSKQTKMAKHPESFPQFQRTLAKTTLVINLAVTVELTNLTERVQLGTHKQRVCCPGARTMRVGAKGHFDRTVPSKVTQWIPGIRDHRTFCRGGCTTQLAQPQHAQPIIWPLKGFVRA